MGVDVAVQRTDGSKVVTLTEPLGADRWLFTDELGSVPSRPIPVDEDEGLSAAGRAYKHSAAKE